MNFSEYTIINVKDNSEIIFDHFWFHGPPETDLISTWKGGSGDAYRSIWKLVSQDDKVIKVKDY